jgi:hypothetical protein
VSSANGEKAKSSINLIGSNLTPLERSRKRGGPIIVSDVSSETDDNRRKKSQTKRGMDTQLETYELIATAIRDEQEARQSNAIARAIRLLQDEYQSRLSICAFDDAVEVLEKKGKAIAFITLSGDARDRWLQKNVNTELDNRELI